MPLSVTFSCSQKLFRVARRGQALMELTFTLPVLILLLIAAYGVGAAMYTGSNASSAVKEAVDNKALYAATDTPITLMESKINGYSGGSFVVTGAPVDSIDIVAAHRDKRTVVVNASKSYTFAMLPTFTFVVSQGIPGNLLRTNVGTAAGITATPYPPTLPSSILPPFVDPTTVGAVPATLPKGATISKADCIPADADIAIDFATSGLSADGAKALIKLYVDKLQAQGLVACAKPMRDNTDDVVLDRSVPAY
ncbi:MAG: pilus assembly protein [Vampirovibrionales bacterium]|nr:pilus assembly protein [Vampirovibrionales bacterium]